MNRKAIIIDCLADALALTAEETENLPDDASLSEYGMDSIHFINMIVLLEEELGMEFLDSDLLPDNFASKQAIFDTIEKYFEK